MKQFSTLLIVLLVSTSLFAQQRRTKSVMGWHLAKDAPAKLNEVKLNLGTTIFGLFPEVSYERVLNEDLSVGGSVGIGLDNKYTLDYTLTPYARWFFGGSSTNLQKFGAGFFIELNGALFSQKEYYDSFDGPYNESSKSVFGAGLGLAIGWKYLSRNNWVGEIYTGVGRDFVNDSAYPRMGISIGKRF